MQKKILIVSMTVGSGHVRAGRALAEYANAYLPQILAEHLDAADIASPLARLFNQKMYEITIQNFPELWGRAYKAFDRSAAAKALQQLARLQAPFCKRLVRYIVSKQPDGIIFTYVGIAQLLAPVCRQRLKNAKLAMVVTDYHGHSLYNIPSIDQYFAADRFVKDDLAQAGVDRQKIEITGMPVSPLFYARRSAQGLKTKYGLPARQPAVLLMPNFLPRGEAEPMIAGLLNLKPKINLIVITSGNKELYYQINSSPLSGNANLTLINWTDAMDEFMSLADAIISKPGGMTVSECISLGKPLIIINPIPGQEERNAQFIERNHLGIVANSRQEIVEAVIRSLRARKRKQSFVQSLERNSCKSIFNYFLAR
jgi:processive 1,2-diacylglycerol beta-glucosyltransferase